MQVFTIRPIHLFAALGAVALGAFLLVWAPWSAQARSADGNAYRGEAPRASNVAMNCAPGQQALVRQTIVDGTLNVVVECAGEPVATAAAYRSEFAQPAYVASPVARPVPVVYSPPLAASQPRPAAPRSVERRTNWGKEALIIGGSAGTGAGIGGLIGGKKGALIGAAIGGGGAALYRTTKN